GACKRRWPRPTGNSERVMPPLKPFRLCLSYGRTSPTPYARMSRNGGSPITGSVLLMACARLGWRLPAGNSARSRATKTPSELDVGRSAFAKPTARRVSACHESFSGLDVEHWPRLRLTNARTKCYRLQRLLIATTSDLEAIKIRNSQLAFRVNALRFS